MDITDAEQCGHGMYFTNAELEIERVGLIRLQSQLDQAVGLLKEWRDYYRLPSFRQVELRGVTEQWLKEQGLHGKDEPCESENRST